MTNLEKKKIIYFVGGFFFGRRKLSESAVAADMKNRPRRMFRCVHNFLINHCVYLIY